MLNQITAASVLHRRAVPESAAACFSTTPLTRSILLHRRRCLSFSPVTFLDLGSYVAAPHRRRHNAAGKLNLNLKLKLKLNLKP
ncbi:hypothetical protein HanRHA438_Chr11g0517891 [Helianthus annuus]|nr:hypothetical protein HanRHA438_Chr11g0517891 [Helianthus annuus]